MSRPVYHLYHPCTFFGLSLNDPNETSFRSSRVSVVPKPRGTKSWKLQNPIQRKIKRLFDLGTPQRSSRFQFGRHKNHLVFGGFSLQSSTTHPLEVSLSQKGFITLSGMALATLVIWVFLGVGAMGHVLKEKMKLSSHCVHRVLRLQNELKKPLVQILKLNPQAKRLRVQQAQTQKRLARAVATGNEAMAAVLTARLIWIANQQLLLRAKQEGYFLQAGLLRQEFHHQSIPGSRRIQKWTHYPDESKTLALTAYPPGSLSPSYKPSNNFSNLQKKTYKISKKISFGFLPQKFFSGGPKFLKLNRTCTATLKQKGELRWTPILKKDKASWRFSYGSA